jgi:hypothetical protein
MFAVLGNGVSLDNKGYLRGNYKSKETYNFPAPEPLESIYPWSKEKEFHPFRKLAGCRDVGFKECAQYFIDCVKITPDSLDGIKEWKNNIHTVEQILLETPTIEDEYSIDDLDKFLSNVAKDKVTDQNPADPSYHSAEPNSSVRKVWFFDVQWSDCPKSVESEVRSLWRSQELGNDSYFSKWDLGEDLFESYPKIYFWLVHKGVPKGESVYIHWWW